MPRETYAALIDSEWLRDEVPATWWGPAALGITIPYVKRTVALVLAQHGRRDMFSVTAPMDTVDLLTISPIARKRDVPRALEKALREINELCQGPVEDPAEALALMARRDEIEAQVAGTMGFTLGRTGATLSDESLYRWKELAIGDVRIVSGRRSSVIHSAYKDWLGRRGITGRIETKSLGDGRVAVRRVS